MKSILLSLFVLACSSFAVQAQTAFQTRFFFREGSVLLTAPPATVADGGSIETDLTQDFVVIDGHRGDTLLRPGQVFRISPKAEADKITFTGTFLFREFQASQKADNIRLMAFVTHEFPFSGTASSGKPVVTSIELPDKRKFQFEFTLTRVDRQGTPLDPIGNSKIAPK